MKCSKCKYDNIIKASYCHKCGNKFTKEEQEKAYNKTIYGKIEKLEKIKKIATLEVITGNIVFKIVSLLIVLGIGIYFLLNMGINTKILNAKEYKIFYNKTDDEYYLVTDEKHDSLNVQLYRPNRIKTMVVYHYNENDTLIEKQKVKAEDNVTLTTYQEDYYVIESKYSNNKKQTIKVYLYKDSDI